MQRHIATYAIAEGQYKDLKQRMLNWANRFSILAFLDSNGYAGKYSRYECLLAAGVAGHVQAPSFSALASLHSQHTDWLFGHICYDHKNALELRLSSRHTEKITFPELYFFVPEVVCHINTAKTELVIESLNDDAADIYTAITSIPVQHVPASLPQLSFQQRIGNGEYLHTIDALRKHIIDGDCYEINFCNEGYCENVDVDPLAVFNKLNSISPAPFAAYYKRDGQYLMCASPERYIRKEGRQLLSQPIKGTAPRNADIATDEQLRTALQNSVKDRAENVMIVDLVRNDLARCCETGSVIVDELFGIYSFPQVHQMISTVSGTIIPSMSFADALQCSFPMGSMTGAPKVKVMELIDRYEQARRGLFSGTVGYITPGGDFDFNVVIRSLFYNSSSKYLAYQTGGAITYDSTPQQEWEEMRLKAWALERVFS